ncbi:MAG: hypothetical protein Q9195_007404 [Heterodermia aff. obscurata]
MTTRPRLERDFTQGYDYEDPRISLGRTRHSQHYHSLNRSRNSPSGHRETSQHHVQELRGEYDIPDTYGELDELAVPAPVEQPEDTRQDVLEDRNSPEGSARNSPTSRGDYDVPDGYSQLHELAAQSPVENRDDTRQDHLEKRTSRGSSARKDIDQEHNLTALATPEPLGHLSSSKESSVAGNVPSAHRQRVSRLATELYTVSYLILFSILGTLARLGLQALTFYPGAPIQTGLLWVNFGGSLFMGFLLEDQKLFRESVRSSGHDEAKRREDEEMGDLNRSDPELQPYIAAAQRQAISKQQAAVKKTIPLYIGLATGFCGSFTSFSAFIRDAYLALANRLPVPVSHTSPAMIAPESTVPRNGGYSFMAICAVILVTLMLSLGALLLGAHLAIALEKWTPDIPKFVARKTVDRMVVFIAWGAWSGAVFMTIWPPDRPGGPVGQASWTQEFWRGEALFALIFAPPGCLLRFYASLHLNGKIQSFPLGTFTVNIFGVVLEGLFFDLQHVPLGGRVGCQVLQGLGDGFCGCLTTVSTWVAELKGLRIRHAYVYGTVSVGVAVGLMVIIMGSYQWTMGFHAPLCGG